MMSLRVSGLLGALDVIYQSFVELFSFMHERLKDSVYVRPEGEFINRVFHVASVSAKNDLLHGRSVVRQ